MKIPTKDRLRLSDHISLPISYLIESAIGHVSKHFESENRKKSTLC